MKQKWNVDGSGHVPIPAELRQFYIAKRNEVLLNLVTSLLLALVAALVAFALAQGLADLLQLAFSAALWLLAAIVPALGLTWLVT